MWNAEELKLNILMIDDNHHDAEIIYENVDKKESIHYIHRETLEESIQYMNSNEVDLVLLDVNLPDTKEPLEGLERIQSTHPHVPVVVVTGAHDQDLVNAALESGASDFLIKGRYRRQRLNSLIRALYQRLQYDQYIDKMERHLDVAVQNMPLVIWSFNDKLQTKNIFGSFESLFFDSTNSHKMNFLSFLKGIDKKNRMLLKDGISKCSPESNWSTQLRIDRQWFQVHLDLIQAPEEKWYIGMITDITSLKASEIEAKLQKQRAEKADRAKSDFLASVSHDLRTPLNGIIGSVQILKQQYHNLDEELISNIYNCSKTLLTLIDDVLDINSMSSNFISRGTTGPVSLYEIGTSCISMLHQLAKSKGLELKMDMKPDVHDHKIIGMERALKKLLMNLLSNAIKYTNHGHVHLKISINEVRSRSITEINIEIEDTGMGMSPNDLENIFEPYNRLDPAYDSESSKGLGLYICKKIIEELNGSIKVKSELGRGSTFYIRFLAKTADIKNVNVPDTSKLKATHPSDLSLSGKNVLVIDDLKLNRVVMSKLLQSLDITVDTAASGREGIDLIKSKNYDLVFLDMRMPEMDGFATVSQLRHYEDKMHKKPTNIVAVSASVDKEYQKRCLDYGCDEFLPKPVIMDQLKDVLSRRAN